ncbi:MAG: hypothetical protein R8P61_33285 [Bacteroidia bacterium]|nr:hypothetical protein [Bacteroidia bacterium]
MRQYPKKLLALIIGMIVLLGLQSFASYRSFEPSILSEKGNAWTTSFDGPANIEKLIHYSDKIVAEIFRIEGMILLPILLMSTAFVFLLGTGLILFIYRHKERDSSF